MPRFFARKAAHPLRQSAQKQRDRFARLLLERLEDRLSPAVNPIVTENLLAGNPESEWGIAGSGDPTIEGFATDISVDQGQTVQFKINDTALAPYRLDIYRMGYYGGLGARKVATIASSTTQRVVQPAPLTDLTTGLIDAGNWSVTATWAVPSAATSGIYFARVVREDTGGASHVVFVVRDDDGGSDLLFQTSDTTWQAYNRWGGNSLYSGNPDGRAYKVSYNRPFTTRTDTTNGRDFVFGTEYPMVRWLEANGYNVSYFTDVDSDRRGAELLEHKAFLSVGHDEYWSGQQRANVEAARDAGVHLAFFSGNEIYWKTRWETSIAPGGTPYRTLVCYKETHNGAKIDPLPGVWTGTWRDPRFSPPADGGRPENALTGQIFTVNRGPGGETGTSFTVPAEFANLRFWRSTIVAALQPGQTATLGDQVLGYEWDEDLDNGFRPGGLFTMSSTTQAVPQKLLSGYGALGDFGPGTATHTLTLYRAASGALVFGAGTVQWSWGLDGTHDGPQTTPDPTMQQATVNLFADMGVQPATLQADLVLTTMSTDVARPSSTITTPTGGVFTAGVAVNITGTAVDTGGGIVAAVEVSVDGGVTWRRAQGRTNWTFSWIPTTTGPVTMRSRAVDDSANLEVPSAGTGVTVQYAATSTTGLVAAYSFNQSSGTTLTDSSGQGNNGTISGATWVPGIYGQALSFDGINDWVTVNDSNSLDLTTGMTIEAWVKPTALPDFTTVVMKERPGGLAYALYASDGGASPSSSYIFVGGSDKRVAGSVVLPLNVWTHLASTYDGSMLRLYVNGTEVGSFAAGGNITVSSGVLRIGGNSVWGEYFQGLIDEVRIYNRPLNVAEIRSDLSTPIGGTIETVAPTVAVSAPSGGATLSGTTTVTASASDNAVVAGVQFFLNGTPLGLEDTAAPYSFAWDTRTVANGMYVLTARARDVAGNSATSPGVTVTVNNTPDTTLPTVTLKYPYHNQPISGSVPLWAVAADNIAVAGVQFKVNGANLGAEVTAAPYRLAWLTTGLANGTYNVTAVARDAAGNLTTSNVATVTVDNTAPTITARTPASGETLVSTATNLTVTFSEPVVSNTIAFTLRDPSNTVVPGTLTYDEATRTVTFNPTFDLLLGTTYTVTVSGARDEAGNVMAGPVTWSFTTSNMVVNATIWDASVTPATASTGDTAPIEVGVKFRADTDGYITGIRFYKGPANTGTHVGRLWSSSGALLGTVTFTNETATGWQQANFGTPVAVTANTTYVASYHAPNGGYAADPSYFADGGFDGGHLEALGDAAGGGNGVFVYGAGGVFPASSFLATNYWVDVVFSNVLTDTTPPTVIGQSPAPEATGVALGANVTATFSESVQAGTISFVLRDSGNNVVPASVTYNDTTQTVTLNPTNDLAQSSTYSVTLSGAQDTAGNTMAPVSWSFTTTGPDVTPPTVIARTPAAGATGVFPGTNVTATFSESIQFSTVSFALQLPSSAVVPASVSYNDATRTLTLNPTQDLDGSATYTVTLSGAKDLAGNTMAPISWVFSTDATIVNATLWNNSVTPAVASANDTAAIEVGVKVRSSKQGYITGVRFYKGAANTGTHVGRVWSSTGALLGTVQFTGETASGWQQANFGNPIPIAANTTYIVSYFAPNGGYSVNGAYFASSGFVNGPLEALSNAAGGGNGVFRYGAGGVFPNDTFNATNYWVDPVFSNTSTDLTAPTVVSQAPSPGATGVPVGSTVTVTFSEPVQAGTVVFQLRDASNNLVAASVSYDSATNTATLTPASPLAFSTTYTATVSGATDLAGNIMNDPVSWSFTTTVNTVISNASLWNSSITPAVTSTSDTAAVELGLKFYSDTDGYVTGVRFYKGAGNTGTHVGRLWTAGGTLLGSVTFTNETATGWQQANLATAVAIVANTTYVVSYFAPNGRYAINGAYFDTAFGNGVLHAPASGDSGGNGVYRYGATGGFPTDSFNATNYWVDLVFSNTTTDVAPTVVVQAPTPGATSVSVSSPVSATFSEPVQPGTVVFQLRDPGNNLVAASVSYDSATNTATLTPTSPLAFSTTYTATVSGATDLTGNVMAPVSWSFTTGALISNASLWNSAITPAVTSTSDTAAVELGLKFYSDTDGYVTGVRFYKGAGNTGTHVGRLWTADGTLLGSVTFTNETATGWQQANLATAVAIVANTTYVISYFAPNGRYAINSAYFDTAFGNGVLHAPASGDSGGNGVFRYGGSPSAGGFPDQTFNASNYWVDLVFSNDPVFDGSAPSVMSQSFGSVATAVELDPKISVRFSEPVHPKTIRVQLRDNANKTVEIQLLSYDPSTNTATFVPKTRLHPKKQYTLTVFGAKDLAGKTMTPVTSTFTTRGAWKQSSFIDFSVGTGNGTEVVDMDGGALQLAFRDAFNGDRLSGAWNAWSWTALKGGKTEITVEKGALSLRNAMVVSKTGYPGQGVEARIDFAANRNQHFGLATGLINASRDYWAVFTTGDTTNTLFAQVNLAGKVQQIEIGKRPNGYHTYKVSPTATGFQFYVDGALTATINLPFPKGTNPRILFSSLDGSPAMEVDWVRLADAPVRGTYTSMIYDTGKANTVWGVVNWMATVPTGTTMKVEVSTSNSLKSGWSSWSQVANGRTITSPRGRYIRYRVTFTTTDSTLTPTLNEITLTWL